MSLSRTFGVWCVLALCMIANGALREVVLIGRIDRTADDVVSAILGVMIIALVTRWLFPPLTLVTTPALLRASVTLVLLALAVTPFVWRR